MLTFQVLFVLTLIGIFSAVFSLLIALKEGVVNSINWYVNNKLSKRFRGVDYK